MAKGLQMYQRPFFYPSMEGWEEPQRRMFPVLMNHIGGKIHSLPLPDLLLYAYLCGLNHMQEVLDKSTTATKG